MLDAIKKASETGLVFCFVGVGSAFAKKHAQTSLIIAKNRKTILVDIGSNIPQALHEKGIGVTDFDYYHFTHSHADHIGGAEELLLSARYIKKQKPKIIITPTYQDILWEKSLKGGCEYNEAGLLRFSDFMTPLWPDWVQAVPRELYRIQVDDILLDIFRTIHVPAEVVRWEQAFWSTGLRVDDRVIFTADTRYDATLFQHLDTPQIETIFHDCQLGGYGAVHATYDEIKTFPDALRQKMYLSHYGDNSKDYNPQKDGFLGFAEPWKIYQWK